MCLPSDVVAWCHCSPASCTGSCFTDVDALRRFTAGPNMAELRERTKGSDLKAQTGPKKTAAKLTGLIEIIACGERYSRRGEGRQLQLVARG